MKHGEKVAPVMAAVTSLATIACCLPRGFAAAAVTASLSMAVAAYQSWFNLVGPNADGHSVQWACR
jgi:hypothetical protein